MTGVDPTHAAFLCPFDCTQGRVSQQIGLTVSKSVRCECDRDECAPAGYVSETLCDCDAVLTPETVAGFDGVMPLCAKCVAERSKPDNTVLGMLALLEAKAQLAADLSPSSLERSIFREIAKEASEVSRTVEREQARRGVA